MQRRDGLGESFGDVVGAARAGAAWAFERLWLTYSPKVAGYLRTQGLREAEDVTSEVFLGAFRSIASFSGDEQAFRAWLFTIAHRRLLDARRSASRAPSMAPLDSVRPVAADPPPDSEVLRRLATDRVRSMCERLVPDQRDVLLLRLIAGFTVEEVAAAVGKSPGAVKALQRRGLVALRKILEREGVPL